MKTIQVMAAALVLQASGVAAQTSLADQKVAADIEKVKVEIENLRLNQLATMRGASGPTAKIDQPAATAEALSFERELYEEVIEKMLGEIKSEMPKGTSVRPIIIFGLTPPNLSALASFEAERDALAIEIPTAVGEFSAAVGRYNNENPKKSITAAVGVISTVVSTAISMFKTDSSIVGAQLAADEKSLRNMLEQALEAEGYGKGFDQLDVINTEDLVDRLLASLPADHVRLALDPNAKNTLQQDYLYAHRLYWTQYKPALAAVGGKPEKLPPIIASTGAALGGVVERYEALREKLLTDAGGVPLAVRIDEQVKLKAGNRITHPLVYITQHEAALSTVTKTGLFRGWRSTPIKMSGLARIDYIVIGKGAKRGSVSCVAKRIPIDDVLDGIGSPSCRVRPATTGTTDGQKQSTDYAATVPNP